MNEKDLLIQPRRGKKEKELPQRALLIANPPEAEVAFNLFAPFVEERKTVYQAQIAVGENRQLCVAGPALGAPAAVLLLEKLIALGVKEIQIFSCCGSLDPRHAIGDILIGTEAVSGEGVSRYYSNKITAEPGPRTTARLFDQAEQSGRGVHRGSIWSTDAPYRERRSEFLRLQERFGVVGVDMEFSALCRVAEFRGVSLGGLFVISDQLWTRNWTPGFAGSDFRKTCREMLEMIINDGLAVA